jgi:hypothetical protein
MRKAAERTVESRLTWQKIGALLDRFTPAEFAISQTPDMLRYDTITL